MRPPVLDPLFAPVSTLPGIGPKIEKLVSGLVGSQPDRDATVADLLFHIPHSLIDRRHRPGIAYSENGDIVTLDVTIGRHMAPPGIRKHLTGSTPTTRQARSPLSSFTRAVTGWRKLFPKASEESFQARSNGSTSALRWCTRTIR